MARWQFSILQKTARTLQPGVFAENAIPVIVSQRFVTSNEDPAYWSIPLFVASLTIFPAIDYSSATRTISVEVAQYGVKTAATEWGYESKHALGNLVCPITFGAALFWDDPPDRTGRENEHLEWECVKHIGEARIDATDKAQVYAIAALLKKLEDSGEMDAALTRVAAQRERARLRREAEASMRNVRNGVAGKPPYKLIKLTREEGSDFAYSFSLELAENASIQTFFGVQNVFANEVLVAYMMEYPNANASTLRIVVHPRLDGGRIIGRAEVLTIAPVSLTYDAGTRHGKLAVRFSANQYEEARAWARKNIETLARDKNIALVTGVIPPAARFYSLGESLKDGNVIEIEFRTE